MDFKNSQFCNRSPPVNHQPSTINRQPSTINHQPSTVNRQPSTINRQPSTVNRQPSTINHQPSAATLIRFNVWILIPNHPTLVGIKSISLFLHNAFCLMGVKITAKICPESINIAFHMLHLCTDFP